MSWSLLPETTYSTTYSTRCNENNHVCVIDINTPKEQVNDINVEDIVFVTNVKKGNENRNKNKQNIMPLYTDCKQKEMKQFEPFI